jgi:mono/diheme cytochrome c family protein
MNSVAMAIFTAVWFGLAVRPASGAELTGPEVFERHCVHCHGASDEAPGTRQLARTRGEALALLTERKDLPAAYIEVIVRNGLRAMPAFVPSDLTDTQLKALSDFLAP